MKYSLFFLPLLLILNSCKEANIEKPTFSIQETLMHLPTNANNEIIAILSKKDGLSIKIDSIEENFICYSNQTVNSIEKLYAILHQQDSVTTKYLTIINHKVTDSILCNTRMVSSDYRISLFEIIDSVINDITYEAFPKEKYNKSFSAITSKKKCFTYPLVFRDSIVLTYYDDSLTFYWMNDCYELANYDEGNVRNFTKCESNFIDPGFIDFYRTFSKTLKNADTLGLIEHIYFPVELNKWYMDYDEMRDTVEYLEASEIDYILSFIAREDFVNSNFSDSIPHFDSYYANTVGRDTKICTYSLAYYSSQGQYGLDMLSVHFTKLDNGYKLTKITRQPAAPY